MQYLLDTNVCIACLRNQPPSVASRLRKQRPDEVAVCSVVRGELLFGAMRSVDPIRAQAAARDFLSIFTSLPFGTDFALI